MTTGTELLRKDKVDNGQLVLVIDDDPAVRRTLVSLLRENGIAVISAADGQDGRDTIRDTYPDLCKTLLILPMPGSGVAL